MTLKKSKLALALTMDVNYEFIVQTTVITIVNYDQKMFIVQATDDARAFSRMTPSRLTLQQIGIQQNDTYHNDPKSNNIKQNLPNRLTISRMGFDIYQNYPK